MNRSTGSWSSARQQRLRQPGSFKPWLTAQETSHAEDSHQGLLMSGGIHAAENGTMKKIERITVGTVLASSRVSCSV
ncbi:hypothetical protein [Paenibacillus sp. SYP-B4298]|uniref:hypothetical protein n=1 Tax=Paenibacillus sp. SYP-B4298 TaxID=2996034 RepID=UPI0022DDCAE8|nr:hypothetical protein [Paenibacillus sp. SYP-B4298]